MVGFQVRYAFDNYKVEGVNYAEGEVTIYRHGEIVAIPVEEVRWIYAIPDSNGFVGRYYGPESVPMMVGRRDTYYMQLPGNGSARFIGEDLLDMSKAERAERWQRGQVHVF